MLCAVALPFSAGTAFAATNTTTNASQTNNSSLVTNASQVSTKNITTNQSVNTTVNTSTSKANNTVNNTTPTVTSTVNNTPSTVTSTVNNTTSTVNATAAAGSPTVSSSNSTKFTNGQIENASARVQTFVDTNNRLPNYVTIANSQVTMSEFLQLLCQSLLNVNNGLNTTVKLNTGLTNTNSSTDTVTSGNIYKAEYLSIAQAVLNFINTNGRDPTYANSSYGKISFSNLVYTYSKIMNFAESNNRLPSYVSVKPWTSAADPNGSAGSAVTLRPVYILSDCINNAVMDNARINAIVSTLNALGVKAYSIGVGVNPNSVVTSLPSNAVLVQVLGGVDPGYVLDQTSAYFKGLLGNRLDMFVLTPGTTETYTGSYVNNNFDVSWLPRSHDDNYDPASFTGMANPGQVLANNGVTLYQNFTYTVSSELTAVAGIIYNLAAS